MSSTLAMTISIGMVNSSGYGVNDLVVRDVSPYDNLRQSRIQLQQSEQFRYDVPNNSALVQFFVRGPREVLNVTVEKGASVSYDLKVRGLLVLNDPDITSVTISNPNVESADLQTVITEERN